MLVAQAKFAMEKFIGQTVPDQVIETVLKKLWAETLNIVLIGMPGAGKSTIGVLLAKSMLYSFVDTDLIIQSKCGCGLCNIIEKDSYGRILFEYNEYFFRK